MSEFSLKIARAIGTPSDTVWAQAHTFSDIFLIIVLEKKPSVDGGVNINLAASGKEFFLHIEQLYSEVFVGGAKRNLDTFRTFISKAVESITDVTIVSFAVALIEHERGLVYLSAKNGQVRLTREGITRPILTSTTDFAFASGFLDDGDLLMLVSSDLASSTLSSEIIDLGDPDEIAEAVTGRMHTAQNQEKQVAFFIKTKRILPLAMVEEEKKEEIQGVKNLEAHFIKGKVSRVVTTVFLLLIILFASSLALGVKKRHYEAATASFTKAYQEASSKYDEGLALTDLNPQLATKTLAEAKDIIEGQLPVLKEKSDEHEKLFELNKKIYEGLRKAFRITTVSDSPLFFDLTLIKEGASGVSMSMYEGKVLVLDEKNQTAYTLTVGSKQSELVVGALSGVQKEAIGADSAYLLDSEGIERVLFKTKNKTPAIKKDDSWGEIGAMVSFAGNLYLLDKINNAIYKYQGTADGALGERRNYLASDVKPDFGESRAMAVDGNVWVLFADGRMSKFTQGVPQSFGMSDMDKPFGTLTSFFTDDETEHLYILDRGNKRVVVVKKDGTYTSQYVWEGMQDVTDLVVSEKEGKILLLSGSKIYSIEIK